LSNDEITGVPVTLRQDTVQALPTVTVSDLLLPFISSPDNPTVQDVLVGPYRHTGR
jgi:hypothetical protein